MAEGLQGFGSLTRRIAQLATDTKHVEGPLNAAGEYVIGSIKRNFLSSGRPRKWPQLAASTIAGRRRGRGRGGVKPLIDTAKMMNALSKRAVEGPGVEVGLNAVQAARQNFGYSGGTGRGHAKTPARQFMMLQVPEDVNYIGSKIFARHFARR
jgi:phage gpG-like protein